MSAPKRPWTHAKDRPPHCTAQENGENCTKPLDNGYGRLCAMHRWRWKTHRRLTRVRATDRWVRPDGYVAVQRPDHPTATRNSQVLEHRLLAYDAWGPGWHECWSCGRRVRWFADLRVVHLDQDRANNDVQNLAPGCHRCAYLHAVEGRSSDLTT